MNTVYIGIDPTGGRRPINYAVLDDDLHLVARDAGNLEKILEVIRAYPSAVVAVIAPQSPNAGLMAQAERRQQYGLPANTETWVGYKVCEYELQKRGIRLYHTPGEIESAPKWMRLGFELYAELRLDGYEVYAPNHAAPKQLLEIHPHASFTVLLGHVPFRKDTLEGRLQRQLVLFEEGLDLKDPMESVEEITRHHLLEGTLHLPGLFTHDELDALVSAYTAYCAARHPEHVTLVGDPAEGQIVVPVARADFKEVYR